MGTTTTAFRLVFDDGTVIATVYDADEAARAREFYADRYQTLVFVERVTVANDPRGR